MSSPFCVLPSLCAFSFPGREATESSVSQQLSVGDDSLGSWSNLSFEDEHPDDNSSFLHLSDRYTTTSFLRHSIYNLPNIQLPVEHTAAISLSVNIVL